MKNIWEEEDFCKIFAFAEENKLPFLQGWEFLQREELEQDNGPGQKVSQEKEANFQFLVYIHLYTLHAYLVIYDRIEFIAKSYSEPN